MPSPAFPLQPRQRPYVRVLQSMLVISVQCRINHGQAELVRLDAPFPRVLQEGVQDGPEYRAALLAFYRVYEAGAV